MSSLKKKLITGNDSLRDNINPIYENDTFKNTLGYSANLFIPVRHSSSPCPVLSQGSPVCSITTRRSGYTLHISAASDKCQYGTRKSHEKLYFVSNPIPFFHFGSDMLPSC